MQELALNSFGVAARACAFDTLNATSHYFQPGEVWVEGHLQNVLDVLVVAISGNSHNPFLVSESIRILASIKTPNKEMEEPLEKAIGLARRLLVKHNLSEYDVWKSTEPE